jgi:hypothetical protein
LPLAKEGPRSCLRTGQNLNRACRPEQLQNDDGGAHPFP